MRRDPDKANRVLLSLVGLALVVVSVWGVGRGAGWFHAQDKDHQILLPAVKDYVSRNAHWFWPVVAVVGVLIALLAGVWLRAQFRLPRRANTDFVLQQSTGVTHIDGNGLMGVDQLARIGG